MTHVIIMVRLPFLKHVVLVQEHGAMSVGEATTFRVRFIIMHVQLKWIATQTRIALVGILDLFHGQVMSVLLHHFWRSIQNKYISPSALESQHTLLIQVR